MSPLLFKISANHAGRVKFFFLLGCALCLLAGCAQVPFTPERQATYAVEKFMQLCVGTQADPRVIESVAHRAGFQLMTPSEASAFTGVAGGVAWAQKIPMGKFVVIARDGGFCSVSAAKADPALLTTAFLSALPGKGAGPESEALPVFEGPNQKIRTFNIKRSGQVLALWILTTFSNGKAPFQGVMSMKNP